MEWYWAIHDANGMVKWGPFLEDRKVTEEHVNLEDRQVTGNRSRS